MSFRTQHDFWYTTANWNTTNIGEKQQNFKVLVASPDVESDWNLGLIQVNVTVKALFLYCCTCCVPEEQEQFIYIVHSGFAGILRDIASSSSVSDDPEEESIISYYFARGYTYEVITEFSAKFHGITMCVRTLKNRLRKVSLVAQAAKVDRLRSMWHTLRLKNGFT